MKIEKSVMIFVFLSLFTGVSCADNNVTTDSKNTSENISEEEYADMFDFDELEKLAMEADEAKKARIKAQKSRDEAKKSRDEAKKSRDATALAAAAQ